MTNMITTSQKTAVSRWSIVALILLWAVPLFAQGTITPTAFQVVLDSSGNPVSGACIWTYTAGTSTPVSTYTDSTLVTPNANPIKADTAGRWVAFLTPGASYKYLIETSCTSPAHGTVIRTQDNIIGVAANNQAGDVIGTAGETLAAGKVVFLSDGQGGKTAGRWYLADNTAALSSLGVSIGMNPSAITSGVTGTIRILGSVTGLAGLTAGQVYYVGTAGALVTAPGTTFSRRVGNADSTTSIVLDDPAARISKTIVLDNAVNVTVSNTVTPTTIYTYPVKANTLGTSRSLRLTLVGEYGNASGSPSDLTVAITFGGQTIGTGLLSTFATGSAGPFAFDIWVSEVGVNFQKSQAMFSYSKSATTTWGNQTLGLSSKNGSQTVDVTAAQSLTVQITHSVANASIVLTMYTATLELIGQ